MPLLPAPAIEITADQVLLGQGANPNVIRARSPRLITAAEHALAEGLPLLTPRILYQQLNIQKIQPEQIVLENNHTLSGRLPAQQLRHAQSIIVILCTVGEAIEKRSLHYLESNPLHSLALYGVGSAAVEALSTAVCQHFSAQAARHGLLTTIPLSPGLEGWSIEQGQPEIFRILDAAQIGVELLPSGLMRPIKSISLVIGIGQHFDSAARICHFCAKRFGCAFQKQHAPTDR